MLRSTVGYGAFPLCVLIEYSTHFHWLPYLLCRVGYGAFPLGLSEYLWRAKQPYNVSVAAEVRPVGQWKWRSTAGGCWLAAFMASRADAGKRWPEVTPAFQRVAGGLRACLTGLTLSPLSLPPKPLQVAALAALSNLPYIERVRDALVAERGRLFEGLQAVPFLQVSGWNRRGVHRRDAQEWMRLLIVHLCPPLLHL